MQFGFSDRLAISCKRLILRDFMNDDRPLPTCPKCDSQMRVTWVLPRLASHPEVTSYTCSACGEVVTKIDGEE
jgi:DNA-directed RNA polymerase subunit RPC12/RpoP